MRIRTYPECAYALRGPDALLRASLSLMLLSVFSRIIVCFQVTPRASTLSHVFPSVPARLRSTRRVSTRINVLCLAFKRSQVFLHILNSLGQVSMRPHAYPCVLARCHAYPRISLKFHPYPPALSKGTARTRWFPRSLSSFHKKLPVSTEFPRGFTRIRAFHRFPWSFL